ncbi:MAG: hypothetical protein RLY31_452 [Bacteroidota bacterium]
MPPVSFVRLLPLLLLLPAWLSAQETSRVTLLHTNDIESTYDPIDAYWNDTIDQIGGIAHLATLIRQVRDTAALTFLLDAGDIFTGALSQHTQGTLPFDIYSTMGYDVMTLGNHEFEYGWQRLADVRNRARFPVLCANIFYQGTDIPFAQPYTILEKKGFRIGVVGVMGIEAFRNTINPIHSEGLEVREPLETAQFWVDRIRPSVDLVILLTHQNNSAPMQTDKEADPDVQRGFDEDRVMAGAIRGVDVIFGGHSDHGLWQPYRDTDTGTLVGITFGQGKYLGFLQLDIDRASGQKNLAAARLIPVVSKELTPDPAVDKLIRHCRDSAPSMTKPIGELTQTAFRRYYRESGLGNLLADLLRSATGADVAVVNAGSLRADLPQGTVSVEKLVNVYPFVDKAVMKSLSGTELLSLLEYSYRKTYGVAQLSGITTVYDDSLPPGQRLLRTSFHGKPIDPNASYSVVSSSFLANGGDGFLQLRLAPVIWQSDNRMIDLLISAFEQASPLTPPALDRQINSASN